MKKRTGANVALQNPRERLALLLSRLSKMYCQTKPATKTNRGGGGGGAYAFAWCHKSPRNTVLQNRYPVILAPPKKQMKKEKTYIRYGLSVSINLEYSSSGL